MSESPGHFREFDFRPVKLPADVPYRPVGLALGQGSSALEVVVATTDAPPRLPQVRAAWRARNAGRAAPLLLVVIHDGRAVLCGPTGDDPPAYENVDVGQVERICREALEQPDRHAALRYLRDVLPSVESRLPGIRNEGFLATHELERGVRISQAWSEAWTEAERKARPVLGRRDRELLRSLGFAIEPCDQVTSILRAGANGKKTAVAVLLNQNESPELQASRFGNLSPVSYALAVADREGLPYVVVLQGSKLRLYPVKVGVGVGRRGRTETYVEIHTGLLRDTDAAYLWLLFSAEALVEGGTLERLLEDSKRFAGSLAERLRERIYGEVVPHLAEGLAVARFGERGRLTRKPSAQELAETYEMAMTVLFRLLFIAYAEDKDLLPYKHNESYRDRSLKRKAAELLRLHQEGTPFDDSDSLWKEVALLFDAVRAGKPEWGVPEYDGGLFANDPDGSRVGALLEQVTLSNQVFGPALRDLLIIQTPEGWGPVDFRSLGVREFGTIYEGLLESELSVAETDLTLDKEGYYRPARRGEEVVVKQNRVYLHDRSGARKSTGTYFTKEFAVEHLLAGALDPAINDHLARLDKLDDDQAAERFFDFRVADIAMGSGHFLVAAVDHIEQAFTQYLARRPLAGVRAELAKLRASATEALGNLADQVEIEDTQLLRRLIARRCIYGVDLNPVSVHLARLSIWIHTFVPGLPLSLLDHNLVVGNSLVGIGRVAEIEELARQGDMPLFSLETERLVGEALEPLRRLAQITDLTAAEIRKARKALAQAREKTRPAEALCDIVTACRMNRENLPVDLQDWEQVKATIVDSKHHRAARQAIADLTPLHFPVAFPEVFLRERSGFDVILGNPPWEEATLEEHAFWARHFPGLRSLNQREQEREKQRLRGERPDLVKLYEQELAEAEAMRRALVTGPYPGMGTGDPDLYKAFCWRFFHLVAADGGRIGVVLPRSAFSAKGTTEFRQTLFAQAEPVNITMLLNTGGWVFDEAEPRYTIGLVAIRRAPSGKTVRLRGPFNSLERFRAGVQRPPAVFSTSDVMSWTDTASLPLLPTEESLDVFIRLRQAPRLDLGHGHPAHDAARAGSPCHWRARPHRELDATNDKDLMDVASHDRPRGFWPVYKGESFDLWEPDRGEYYAWADPKVVVPHLADKRGRGRTRSNSVWYEFRDRPEKWFRDEKTLPCFAPRIAFRDVTNRTNQRTVIAALVPPKVFIANQAPCLIWTRGDEKDEAYLLAVLASLPLDWYARRFVETHVNFYVFNPFPIPRPGRDDPLWQRAVALAGRLAAVDDRYADWAAAVARASCPCPSTAWKAVPPGTEASGPSPHGQDAHATLDLTGGPGWRLGECGPLPADRKYDLICELDAVVAHLYGLDEKHLVHIFETFHEGWGPGTTANHPTLGEYDRRLKTTLAHYRRLAKELFPTVYQRLKPIIDVTRETQAENADTRMEKR